MANDINLLPVKDRSAFSQEQLLSYAKIAAIISSIITVSLAIALFLLNKDPTLTQLQAEQQTVLAQLTLLHSKTAKDLIILNRIQQIEKVTKNRQSLDRKIDTIQSEIPAGVTVMSFILNSKSLSMTLSAQSLAPLGAVIENMTKNVQNKQIVRKVTIEGIISDEQTGEFLLTISGDLL